MLDDLGGGAATVDGEEHRFASHDAQHLLEYCALPHQVTATAVQADLADQGERAKEISELLRVPCGACCRDTRVDTDSPDERWVPPVPDLARLVQTSSHREHHGLTERRDLRRRNVRCDVGVSVQCRKNG